MKKTPAQPIEPQPIEPQPIEPIKKKTPEQSTGLAQRFGQTRLFGLMRTNPRVFVQLLFVFLGGTGLVLWWPRVPSPPAISYTSEVERISIEKTVTYELAKSTYDSQRSLGRAIAATVLLVGLVDLLTSGLAFCTNSLVRRDFGLFFGQEAVKQGCGLVAIFNSGTVKEEYLTFNNAPEAAKAATAVAEGIEHVLPYEDLKATLELSREFERFGSRMEIATDEEYKDTWPDGKDGRVERAVLAVGLGFNAATARIALIKPGLFAVNYDGRTPSGSATDGFTIGIIGDTYPKATANHDYALLARVVDPQTQRIYFVCAGRTAEGTEAACRYLASHWSHLFRAKYRSIDPNGANHATTKSFAMILRHVKGEPNYVEEYKCEMMP